MRLLEMIYAFGRLLIEDDIKDYMKFDRWHHWHLGELLRTGALLGSLAYLGSKAATNLAGGENRGSIGRSSYRPRYT